MEKSETRVYPFLVRRKYSHALIPQDPGTPLPSQRVALSALPTATKPLGGVTYASRNGKGDPMEEKTKNAWQILQFRAVRSYGVLHNPMLGVASSIV